MDVARYTCVSGLGLGAYTSVKLQYRTRPYPHQVRALKKILHNRGGGLQVPMRWGKSWVAINFSAALYHLEDVRRVLVITVTSGLGVWEGQVAQHCPVAWSTYIHGAQDRKLCDFEQWAASAQPREDATTQELQFYIVNFQNLYEREYDTAKGHEREWVAVTSKAIADFNPEIVVVDESHHIGNPTVIQSSEARKVGRKARFRLFMTGSMFHRKPRFVFGQMKFYDDGAALGSSFEHYKKRIEVKGGFGGYETLRYRNLKWMVNQLKPTVYMEDYVPPRDTAENVIEFDLTGRNLQYYSSMSSKGIVREGNKTSTAEIILTKHLRLLQICGGFLSFDGTLKKIGSDKLDMCKDRLIEYREQGIDKAVIGCRFISELVAVGRLSKALGFLPVLFHGGVKKGDERTRRVALFQETSKPVLFISQIAAGKESIDLSEASVMMFFSLTESYVAHDQFSKRIEKYGETRTLMYDFLIGRGTRDAVTLAGLQLQEDIADYIVNNPKRVEEIATLENRKKVVT